MSYNEFAVLHPVFIFFIVGLFSLCVGSFLNVVIHRIPIMLNREWRALSAEYLEIEIQKPSKPYNLITPLSTCPKCESRIKPWHNIPILSYLWLKGKCAHCKNPISIRYPLVEATTAILSLLLLIKFGLSAKFLCGIFFSWILIALTMIDFDTQLLPDSMTLPLIWIGLLINSFELFIPLKEAVYCAMGAYLFLWLFVYVFNLLTGKEGMGEGDFKLFSAFGAWFGWQALPLILVMSSFAGAIIGIITLKLSKKNTDTPLAFGPYLCIAAYIYLLYGSELIAGYITMFLR